MNEKDKYPSDAAERFQVRLPPGLRDRIKAYSERHGRSMNSEIVRVLEREFPEQWSLEERLEQLSKLFSVLSAGVADPSVDEYLRQFRDTVNGIISGRVIGVDGEVRAAIKHLWEHYSYLESERQNDDVTDQYDEEELSSLEVTGVPEKYAVPLPREPDPFRDGMEIGQLLPPKAVADLAECLGKADLEAAIQVLSAVPRDYVEKRVRSQVLPIDEQIRQKKAEPPFRGDDPFETDD
tara:strand:- start:164 stop:874 length:711 start_codon:yes stop_codon:yes gene_type:complete